MKSLSVRPIVSVALALATHAVAPSAQAVSLDFEALPSAAPLPPPARKAAPSFVAGTQVVPGLHRIDVDKLLRRQIPGFREFAIYDDAERAAAFSGASAERDQTPFRRSMSCFAMSSNFRVPEAHDPRPLVWDSMSADRLSVQTYANDTLAKVIPVRAERWLEADGGVRIETTRFWVDLRTGGTRLIDRSTSDVARVASPFADVAVYARRSGPESVSFFVRRDIPEKAAAPFDPNVLVRPQFNSGNGLGVDLTTIRTTMSDEVAGSECVFQHVDLSVLPETNLDGPIAPEPDEQAKRVNAFAPVGNREAEIANVAFNVVVDVQPEAAPARPASSPRPFEEARGSATVRSMLVNLGISRGAPGKPAVPSVSYGWSDRARVRPF